MKTYTCDCCGQYYSKESYEVLDGKCSEHLNRFNDDYVLCNGNLVKDDILNVKSFNEFTLLMENKIQEEFDLKIKPIIINDMKRLNIIKIESIMGVDFITMRNGKVYSDTEFLGNGTEKMVKFYYKWLRPLGQKPWYTLINYNIEY